MRRTPALLTAACLLVACGPDEDAERFVPVEAHALHPVTRVDADGTRAAQHPAGPSAGDLANEDVPPLTLVLPDGSEQGVDADVLGRVTPTRIPLGLGAEPATDTRAWRVDGFILAYGGATARVASSSGSTDVELDDDGRRAILRVAADDTWRLEWMGADGRLAEGEVLRDVPRLEIQQLPGLPVEGAKDG